MALIHALVLAVCFALACSADNATSGGRSATHDAATSLISEVNALLDKDRGRLAERMAFLGAGVIGVTGYFVKYCLDKRREQRLWRIDRISRQLEEFYGPLHYGVFAQQARFNAMLRMYAKDAGEDVESTGLFDVMVAELAQDQMRGTGDSAAAKLWMGFVRDFAIPLNRQHADILTKKGHLYDGHYPEGFKAFLKHAADLELMAKRWEQGDFSVLNQQFRYPIEMDREIERKLEDLISIKAELLGSDEMLEPIPKEVKMRRLTSSLYMQSSNDQMSTYQDSNIDDDVEACEDDNLRSGASSPVAAGHAADRQDLRVSFGGESPHSRQRRGAGKAALAIAASAEEGRGGAGGGESLLATRSHPPAEGDSEAGEAKPASGSAWGALLARWFPAASASFGDGPLPPTYHHIGGSQRPVRRHFGE